MGDTYDGRTGGQRAMDDHGSARAKPSADVLASAAKAAKGRGPAPVHLWDPPFCGDMDLVIRRDGTWIHEGTPIGRPGMVRLFASILKREGDAFFLVTPVEKVGIRVEDAPFVAVDVAATEAGIAFETNVGDRVVAGPDAPIRVAETDGEPAPYVEVRRGLEALIDRKSFYRLVEMGEERDGWIVVSSRGATFRLGRVG